MVTKSVARPTRTRQAWTDPIVDWRGRKVEAPEVIGAAWSDEGADYQAYLDSRRPAPPSQPNPDDEPDPPTTPAPAKPRMFNGYEHPGPAPRELVLDAGGEDSFVKRAERVARELIVHEGQRQAEERRQREKLIAAQVAKAKTAGHESKRVDRAARIVTEGELDAAIAKYGTTTAGCSCPDARWRGHGGSAATCKHKLAAIISHNVERAMKNGAEAEAVTPTAQAEPAGCPTCGYPTAEAVCPVCAMVIDPLSDDVPIEVLDPAAIPVHTPDPVRDAQGMLWS